MNRTQALTAIRAAGITATFNPADDESVDDAFTLNGDENIEVQICATRDGLRFVASFADGEGDDFGVTHGQMTTDPVVAAREAILLANG